MKEFILTGVAQETSLRTNNSKFFLVFNQGELRVPVDSNAAEVVLANFYASNPEANPALTKEAEAEPSPTEPPEGSQEQLNYDFPSMEDYGNPPNLAMQSFTDDETEGEDFDADGVGQF